MYSKLKSFADRLSPFQFACLIILVYVVLLAPYCLQYIFFLPDEHHYVDAATYMLQHGDYFSPHTPNGGYRFLKPIFTYWAVLFSYAVFGISQFSSRFPFLVAAALVLLMTFKMSWLATEDRKISILAVLLLGSIPIFNRSVGTSLTDIWQLLFLEVMTYAVFGIIKKPLRRRHYLDILYLSAGLAVTVKGIVALAFLGVCLLFLLINPWNRLSVRKLLRLPSITAFLVIGGFWYVIIYIQHGPDALFHFYQDQVGIRVAGKFMRVVLNAIYAVITVVVLLFPFIVAGWRSLLFRSNRQVLATSKNDMSIIAFCLFWLLAMTGMASMVSQFYYRYMIPVCHIEAFLFAFFIIKNEHRKGVRISLQVTRYFGLTVFILMGIASLIANWFMGPAVFSLIATILLVAIGLFLLTIPRHASLIALSVATFFYMTATFTLLALTAARFSDPDQGEQIVTALSNNRISPDDQIQYFGKTRIASRIRVASQGKFFFSQSFASRDSVNADYIVFGDHYKDSLNLDNYRVKAISAVWKDYPIKKIIQANTNPALLRQLRWSNSENYYLAVKKKLKKQGQ